MDAGRREEEEEEEEEVRIKTTVLEILNSSNMEETTEYKVRKTASDKLGLDLSIPIRKRIVSLVVEDFLIHQNLKSQSQIDEVEDEDEDEDDNNNDRKSKNKKKGSVKEYDDDGDLIICKLSDKRRVTIQDFKGKTLVSMREYYKKDGKEHPTAKGISLTAEQWSTFKKNVPAIEKAIQKMESRLN